MYRAISKLRQHNISIFSIKTDALTIRSEHLELVKELLDFSPGIGKWRHSKTGADIKFPTKPLHNFDNKLIKISKPEINNIPITIEQEYDTEYICKEIIEKTQNFIDPRKIRRKWKIVYLRIYGESWPQSIIRVSDERISRKIW